MNKSYKMHEELIHYSIILQYLDEYSEEYLFILNKIKNIIDSKIVEYLKSGSEEQNKDNKITNSIQEKDLINLLDDSVPGDDIFYFTSQSVDEVYE